MIAAPCNAMRGPEKTLEPQMRLGLELHDTASNY